MDTGRRTGPGAALRVTHLLAGTLAVVAYAFVVTPGSRVQAALELGLHASVAPLILYGVRLHRPSRAIGWYVIAGSQVFYAAGNVLGTWLPAATGATRPFPSTADLLYLVAYLGLAVGAVLILVHRSRNLGIGIVLDTATVAIGLSSLAWVLLVEPLLPSATGPATLVVIGYALVDVALVAVLVHVALAPGARSPALMLLAGALGAQLVGDVLYTLQSAMGTVAGGTPAFLAYMSFYVLLAAASLSPSMRRLAEPDDTVRGLSPVVRMGLLATAAMLPPATLLVQGSSRRVTVLAGITMVTFACVLVRLVKVHGELQETARAQRMQDQLLSVVSHEIRTPLTVVSGALATLQRGVAGPLQPQQATFVSMAADHTARLTRLVTDLLDLQRSGRDRLQLRPCPTALDGVVHAAELELSERIAGARVEVVADLRGLVVDADPERLHQVLVNLLDNALKFSDPGGQVAVRARRRADEVLVRVVDHGRGIPMEMHERIFLPFQQVDASDSREHNGTGLGLAICRALVEQHGGRIWVESAPDTGATFLFTLPLARVVAPTAPDRVPALR